MNVMTSRIRVGIGLLAIVLAALLAWVYLRAEDSSKESTADWPRIHTDAISFGYPPFWDRDAVVGKPVVTPHENTVFIELPVSVHGGPFLSTIGITLAWNPKGATLAEWIAGVVDIDNILTAAGTYQPQTLSNGEQILVMTGQVPTGYIDKAGPGSLPYAYRTSPSGQIVASITLSQDHDLDVLGYTSTEEKRELSLNILETVTFNTSHLDTKPDPNEKALPTHIETYRDANLGISFDYLAGEGGFTARTNDTNDSEGPNGEKAIHLTYTRNLNYSERVGGLGSDAGAPTISILVFKNPENLSPRAWVGESEKRISRQPALELVDTTLAEAPGVYYFVQDCLNGSCGVWTVTHGDRIYQVSGHMDERNFSKPEPNLAQVLETFKFLP